MSKTTQDDVKEMVREVGQTEGSWSSRGGKHVRPLFLDEQLDLARSLMGLLQQQESALSAEIQRAQEALHKLKFGGGR